MASAVWSCFVLLVLKILRATGFSVVVEILRISCATGPKIEAESTPRNQPAHCKPVVAHCMLKTRVASDIED